MKFIHIISFLLVLTLNEANAQKVPRPGGGGEDIELLGEKETIPKIKTFFKIFHHQLKSCDPKRKVEMNFEDVFNYLFHRHMETLMKASHFNKKNSDYCHKENGNNIDCIMNEKLKDNLKELIASKYVENYFRTEKNLSKKEIKEKIDFLNHLVEK
jgi:hypothetical protein